MAVYMMTPHFLLGDLPSFFCDTVDGEYFYFEYDDETMCMILDRRKMDMLIKIGSMKWGKSIESRIDIAKKTDGFLGVLKGIKIYLAGTQSVMCLRQKYKTSNFEGRFPSDLFSHYIEKNMWDIPKSLKARLKIAEKNDGFVGIWGGMKMFADPMGRGFEKVYYS